MTRSLCLVAVVTVGILATACAAPPDQELALAKSKTEAAVAAGAERLVPAATAAMVSAQAALDAELLAQSSRWFKSYSSAGNLAIAVQAAADRAATEAASTRDRTLAAARAPGAESLLGSNLFQNGAFENGTKPWSVHPDSDATVSVATAEGGERAWHVTYRKGNWSVIYQEFELKPDTVYVYEAWVKTTAPVVSLYWQSDIGRYFETDTSYPVWTRARNVFVTPHWSGQPLRVGFCPVLMQGAGEAWLRDVRISEVTSR